MSSGPYGEQSEEVQTNGRKERKSSTTFTRQNNPRKKSAEREALVRILSHSHLVLLPLPPGAPTVAGNSLGEERSGRPSGPSVPFPPPSPKVKPCSRVLAAKISGFYRVILKGENLGLFGRLNLGGSRGDSVRAIHFRCARASGSTRGFGCLVLGYGFSFSAVSPI
jgi:hypothetical protein